MSVGEVSRTDWRAVSGQALSLALTAEGIVEEDADEGLAVEDISGVDEALDLGERGHMEFDLFVVFGRGLAEGEVFGEQDVHGFGEEAGAGEVLDVAGPFFGAVAGLFDELAFGGGDELFAGFDAASGEFEEELTGGVAVLADEQDAGVGGVGFGVDGEDDDGVVVADDVAFGADAAGFDDFVGGDVEDFAFVDGFGGEGAGFAGEFCGLCGRRGLGGGLGGHGVRVNELGGEFEGVQVWVHRYGLRRIQKSEHAAESERLRLYGN